MGASWGEMIAALIVLAILVFLFLLVLAVYA